MQQHAVLLCKAVCTEYDCVMELDTMLAGRD